MSSAYLGEGFPWSFLHQLTTEYLQSSGAPPTHVGYTSWFHLPVTLKPILGPVLDVVGTRRGWMLATQMGMGVGMAAIAALVGLGLGGSNAPWLWILLALLALMHATHDIACDGLYMLALDARGQALHSGTRIAAFRVAMYVGGSALVILAAHTSWTLALGLSSALMATIAAVNAAITPRPAADAPRSARPEAPSVWQSYATFLAQPRALLVLAFVIGHGLSDAMTFTMSAPLLDGIGVGQAMRGWIRALGLSGTIAAAVLAGWLIARHGLERWLAPLTYLMAIPFYLAIAALRPPLWAIAALVAVEQFTGNLAATALTIFLMRRCRKAFSASHYAFFTALAALGRTIAGGLSGHLYREIGPSPYFLACFVAALPAVVLVHFVPKLDLEDAQGGFA